MENALLVTDTKFSSRERSRVGKYNRPPSLPASLPSLLLRTLRPAAQRKNVAKAFSLPSMFHPTNCQLGCFFTTSLPLFLLRCSFGDILGSGGNPSPAVSGLKGQIHAAALWPRARLSFMCFYSFHFHNSRCGRKECVLRRFAGASRQPHSLIKGLCA